MRLMLRMSLSARNAFRQPEGRYQWMIPFVRRPFRGGCRDARERVLLPPARGSGEPRMSCRRGRWRSYMPGGFWHYAQEDPSYLAVVDTDGTEISGGAMLAECNRVAHALRALGLQAGDTVAAVLPNGKYPATVYLAALQIGLYYVPINYRLSPPEIAYILADSDASVFVTHERFADLAVAAADDAGIPAAGRLAVGAV